MSKIEQMKERPTITWTGNGNRIEKGEYGCTSPVNHKVFSIGTTSTKRFLKHFDGKILLLKGKGENQVVKKNDEDLKEYGINLKKKEFASVNIKHDSTDWTSGGIQHSQMDPVVDKIIKRLEYEEIDDVAIDQLLVEIEDEKLGQAIVDSYKEKSNYYSDLLLGGNVRRIRPSDERFVLKFTSYPCEKEADRQEVFGKDGKNTKSGVAGEVQEINRKRVEENKFKKRLLHLDGMINRRQLMSVKKRGRIPIVLTSLTEPFFLFKPERELKLEDSFVRLVGSFNFRSRYDVVRHLSRQFNELNYFFKYYGTKESKSADLEGITR